MLKLEKLCKTYRAGREEFTALNEVSLELAAGESLGIVGESGAGKSTLARCILGVERPDSGLVWFKDREITTLNKAGLFDYWQRAQMIWQDPMLALSPHLTMGKQVAEPLGNYTGLGRVEIRQKARRLLETVGLDPTLENSYSHQLSGGQCQRVCIARALALEPELLICDEPVSALDLPMQLKVMELIRGLKQRLGISLIIITHDLGLARRYCDMVAIMQKGRVVESGPADVILRGQGDAYTRRLLAAVPRLPWGEDPA